MVKKATKIIIFALLGAVYMVNNAGCSRPGKYNVFVSKDPDLNITMEYISGWEVSETRGANNSYSDVYFGEPWGKPERPIRAYMEVNSSRCAVIAGKELSVEEYTDDYAGGLVKFMKGKVLKKSKIKLPAGDASDTTIALKGQEKLYSPKSNEIDLEQRIVILKNGGRFYVLTYQNTKSEFEKYGKDFDHIIKSLRFKEKS